MPVAEPPAVAIDAVLAEMHAARTTRGDDDAIVDISEYAVRAPAARVLEGAAEAAAADTMIEIGMASALSTLAICRGRRRAGPMADGCFHVIDPHQDHFRNCGLHALRRAGVASAVTFHRLPAHVALPRLLDEGVRPRFAFVDGQHQLDNVIAELYLLDYMLDVGGVVALHDMWMPGLQHAVSYWLANRAYEAVTLDGPTLTAAPCASSQRGCGDPERRPAFFREHAEPFVDATVLLMRKTGEDERGWDFFREFV
ncbi:MAG: class I SAM-dependent methyltransferase [Planctomycetes bacterium]|nr:class I SAM-dependent methyltransferase [Planctomycetota bacterium]